jgi:outer membrane autotransporter protein
LAGTGGIIKQGLGTLTLSGANTYSGGTVVGGGALQLSGSGTLGSSSGATTVNAGTLDLGGTTQTQNGGLTLAGGTVQNGTLSSSGAFGLQAGTVTAALAGTGALNKTTSGTVTLSGANTYSGPTTIGAGILALGSGGSLASSSGVNLTVSGATFDISNGGNQTIKNLTSVAGATVSVGANTLTFGAANSTTFAGSFTGSGGLAWQGTGSFTLTGNSSAFTGSTTIESGTVALGSDVAPNASLGGNVSIAGGMLKGFGTIGGNLANAGGTVQPGGSIGTLTVGGNYSQASTGTLSIEVSPTVAASLAVAGAASLAGKLALVFDPGVYTPTSYKLLTASSVSGTFSAVTGTNPSGLAQMVLIDPADVTLQLSNPQSPTSTPTPVVIAPTNDTVYAAATTIAINAAQQVNSMILDRLGQREAGIADGDATGECDAAPPDAPAADTAAIGTLASALPRCFASEGTWFRGVGGFASVNGSSTAPGFIGETGGFLLGIDRPVADNVYLGVAGGYLHSNIDEHSTSSGTEGSTRVALYGGALVGPGLFTGTAGYAHDWFDTQRGIAGIGMASQSHGGNEATAAAQWSLPLAIQGYGNGIATLTPKAGVQFVHLSEDGFSESGASGFDLSSSNRGTDSFQPYIGAALAQKFVTDGGTEMTPELRFGYAREALSGSRLLTVTAAGGASFPVIGVRPSRDQVTAGIGITVVAGPDLSLYANYDAILPTGNTTDHTLSAGLRWKF